MKTSWALSLALVLGLTALPALAGHKHRRGCGHVYSRGHGGWISINVATRNFGFSYSRAPRYSRYDRDRYYGDPYGGGYYGGDPYGGGYYGRGSWDPYYYDRSYDRHRGYWKKHRGHRHGYKARCRY